MSKLYITGIGPGSADYITAAAKNAVKSAQIIIGSERALDLFPEARNVVPLNVKNIQEKLEDAVEMVNKGTDVCVLSTGDPGFSGILRPIKRIIEEKGYHNINLKVIPGISSLQLCASIAEISWDDANLISFHGNKDSPEILKVLNNGRPTIMLPLKNPRETAEFLMDKGLDGDRRVIICENMSYPDEKVVDISLKEASKGNFSYMCVMIIF